MTKETADKIRQEMAEGYKAAASETSPDRERLYGEELKRFVDYVREKEAVLDVGCGEGHAYEVFKPKSVAYMGVDIAEHSIARARDRWKGQGAVFEKGDLLALPVPDGKFDVVLALGVLHHAPGRTYRLVAMRELARAARKGGYVLIANWNLWRARYWGILLHQRFGRKNGWDFGDLKVSWKKPLFPRYYHAFRKTELRKLCEAAGLDVVEQYYVTQGIVSDWAQGENLVTIGRKR
jgi:SAM-dependent methyltransferase